MLGMGGSRVWWAAAGVAAGVLVAGLGVFFTRVGLNEADQYASVFGVFLALIGLGVSVYSVVLARRALLPSPSPQPSPTGDAAAPTESQAPGGTQVRIGRDNHAPVIIGNENRVNDSEGPANP